MNANVMKTNNGKRLIAAVAVLTLALCVCVVAIPSESSDAMTSEEFIAEAENNQIVLDGDTTVNGAISLNNMSVNLAGYTLTVDSTINLVNSSISNGSVTGNFASTIMTLQQKSTISGLTITQNGSYASLIDVVEESDVTIENCIFTDNASISTSVYINGDASTSVEIVGCDLGIDSDARAVNWIGAPGQLVIDNCTSTHIQVCGPVDVESKYVFGENVVIENTKIDKLYVNIDAGNSKGTSEFIVPAGQTITVNILDGNGTSAEVSGELIVLKTSNLTINGTGNTVISETVTEPSQANIDNAYVDNESVYISSGNVASVSIPEGKTLVIGSDATLDASTVITTAPKTTIIVESDNNTFTVQNAGENGDSVKFENFTGEITITYGSVSIDGTEYSGTLYVTGEVDISGSIKDAQAGGTGLVINAEPGSEITIDKNLVIGEGGLTIKNNGAAGSDDVTVIVPNGVSVDLQTKLSLNMGVRMNSDGDINGGGEISVAEGAVFYTSEPVDAIFSGKGSILLEDAMETVNFYGTLSSNFDGTATQNVIISDNLTIGKNQYVIVRGNLEVPAGVTVTIEDGGLLLIDGTTASANIAGTIVSKGTGVYNGQSYAGFSYDAGTGIDITGTVEARKASNNGTITVDIQGETNLEGTIQINTNAAASFGDVTVASTGKVNVDGEFIGTIYNQGTVVVGGTVGSNATIYMAASGAVVQITSLDKGILNITDQGMYLRMVNGVPQYVAGDKNTVVNSISFSNVKNVTITEGVVYKTDADDNRYPVNEMYLEGTAGVADSKNTSYAAYASVDDGKVIIANEYTLNKVEMRIADGAKLQVDGTVYVNDATDGTEIVGDGTLSVNGTVDSVTELNQNDNYTLTIEAVMYETIVENITHYIYTNLADAIESGAEDITVMGDLYILENTTIPNGVDIDAESFDVYVGYEDVTDVTLTVANGGNLIADEIYVNGTMVVENIDTGVEARSIISDTSNVTETSGTYTNIYNALATAGEGETVTITKTGDGTVTLTRDATIGEGVTLQIPANKTLLIDEEVTLTVNGTLDNKGTIDAVSSTTFGTEEVEKKAGSPDIKHAVIKVNGTLVSSTQMTYDYYKIAGAYYTMKTRFYITPVEDAASVITQTDGYIIEINGDVSAGTVAFNGTADKPVIIDIKNNANVIVDSMTVAYGNINAAVGAKLDGAFGTSAGNIDFTNSKVTTALAFADRTVSAGDSDVQRLYVSGAVSVNDEGACVVVINGEVYISGTFTADVKYTENTTPRVGTITVASGSTLNVVSGGMFTAKNAKMTIEGTVITNGNGSLVAESDSMVIVLGTLQVDAATDSVTAGTANIDDLRIGGKNSAEAAAVVSGEFDMNEVRVFTGVDIAEDTMAILDDARSTEFYVENELWMTAYDVSGSDWDLVTVSGTGSDVEYKYDIEPKLTDSVFSAWQYDNNGTKKALTSTTTVGTHGALYAYIDYDIYKVTVFADPGITAVYIDGKLMTSGYYMDQDGINLVAGFQAFVSAGEHEITYKLGNYFSGEATMTVNGDAVSGNTFTTSGTPVENETTVNYTIYLQGINASAPETPSSSDSGSDDGMGLTDYLLIILVVLIVIMAIIVALRLMRS